MAEAHKEEMNKSLIEIRKHKQATDQDLEMEIEWKKKN